MATALEAKTPPPVEMFSSTYTFSIKTPRRNFTRKSWFRRDWVHIRLHIEGPTRAKEGPPKPGKGKFDINILESGFKKWLKDREKFLNKVRKSENYPACRIIMSQADKKRGVVFSLKQFSKLIEVGTQLLKEKHPLKGPFKVKYKRGDNGSKRSGKTKDHGSSK